MVNASLTVITMNEFHVFWHADNLEQNEMQSMYQSKKFLFDSSNVYFGVQKYICELSLSYIEIAKKEQQTHQPEGIVIPE